MGITLISLVGLVFLVAIFAAGFNDKPGVK